MYSYKDKPFNIYRNKEIYPLNDTGFEKYISYDSHNVNYLKVSNPKVYRHILNMEDKDIPEKMRLEVKEASKGSKWDFSFIRKKKEEETKCEVKAEEPVKAVIEEKAPQQKTVEEVKIENKPVKTVNKMRKKKLPPIKVNNSCDLSKYSRKPNIVISPENNTCKAGKLKLPEIMKTNGNKYETIVSNIHLVNSKEFGPSYCPFSAYIKTGDYIGTNVYGAKFNH